MEDVHILQADLDAPSGECTIANISASHICVKMCDFLPFLCHFCHFVLLDVAQTAVHSLPWPNRFNLLMPEMNYRSE